MCFAGKILRSWIKSYRQKHYFNCQRLTDFVKRSINYIFRSPKWRNSTVTTSSWGLKLTTWGLRCKAVSITLTKTSTSRIYFYRYFTLHAASDSCTQNSILSACSFIFCFTSFSNYRFIKRRQLSNIFTVAIHFINPFAEPNYEVTEATLYVTICASP